MRVPYDDDDDDDISPLSPDRLCLFAATGVSSAARKQRED
jgi:hypothetical protein